MLTTILVLAAQAVAPPSVMAKADDDKVRCQAEYQVHTRIPTQICRTKGQWRSIEKAQQDDLESSRHAVGAGRSGTIVSGGDEAVITSINIPGGKGQFTTKKYGGGIPH